MPRSRFSQVLALLLFAIGAAAVPGWELLHSLEHQHQRHTVELRPAAPVENHSDEARFTEFDPGHQHPVFSVPIRPFGDASAVWAALPAVRQAFVLGVGVLRTDRIVITEARAGPVRGRSPQSRAPPLL